MYAFMYISLFSGHLISFNQLPCRVQLRMTHWLVSSAISLLMLKWTGAWLLKRLPVT